VLPGLPCSPASCRLGERSILCRRAPILATPPSDIASITPTTGRCDRWGAKRRAVMSLSLV
jgi:hypothetical protein